MIRTFDYLKIFEEIEDEVMEAIRQVLHSGWLILGPETEAFETEFAKEVGAKHCIGVASGTVALHLALMSMEVGPGDEVITVANTCTPTISAIELSGATPVFVDVRDEDLMIDPDLVEAAITERTRCILPVHLWGQGVDITRLMEIAEKAGVYLLEDCAQAQSTRYQGQHAGTFGNAGCFSFYPTKNLGAYGDAGAIITNDDDLAEQIRLRRMYGYVRRDYAIKKGMNGRIAELQAAILRVKMRYLSKWITRRREIAAYYDRTIDHPQIGLPYHHKGRDHAYHQYVIRCENRDKVIEALKAQAIGYGIHYATPIHLMTAYEELGCPSLPVTEKAADEILSLPLHEALSDEQIEIVARTLNGVS